MNITILILTDILSMLVHDHITVDDFNFILFNKLVLRKC